jgi:molybdenum cofactor biosynthesis enzyme MoaA
LNSFFIDRIKFIALWISDEIKERIDRCEDVFFQGGEPTMSIHLFELIRYAKSQGKKVGIVTNGLRLAYLPFTEDLMKSGVDQILFAYHSADPETANRLARYDRSFEFKEKGIKNVIKVGEGRKIRIITVISRLNYRGLPDIVDHINRAYPEVKSFELKLIQLLGNPGQNKDIMPNLEHVSRLIPKKPGVMTNGIPPCFLAGDYERTIEHRMITRGEVLSGREHTPDCAGCELRPNCLGIRSDYLQVHRFQKPRQV